MRGNLPLASRWPLTMASMMLGWSDPRLTKQCVMPASQMASKKANDAVYISGDASVDACLFVARDLLWVELAEAVTAIVLTRGDTDVPRVVADVAAAATRVALLNWHFLAVRPARRVLVMRFMAMPGVFARE
jgi:hypothetical protein